MTTSAVIPIDKKNHPSEDYEFLRAEGLKYVEQLSSSFWTDFNIHDPGITLKEALCYAITDLGYRTSLPMKDLLAKEGVDNTNPNPPLFTARHILSNNPHTITDFRKLLVDIDGIKNAWLEVADCQEVNFYAECKNSTLKYFQTNYKVKLEKLELEKEDRKVFKRIMNDPNHQDNERFNFSFKVKAYDNVQNIDVSYQLEIPLPGWNIIENLIGRYLDFINSDVVDEIRLQQINFDNPSGKWQADILVKYITGGVADTILFQDVLIMGVQQLSIKAALESYLRNPGTQNPIFQYQQKIKKRLALETEHTIRLRGLSEVLIQYDLDNRFGDLNSDLLNYKLVIEENKFPKEANLEIIWAAWSDIYRDIKSFEPFILSETLSNYTLVNSFEDDLNNTFTTDIHIDYEDGGNIKTIIWENVLFKGISNKAELEKDFASILSFFKGKLRRLLSITWEVENCLHEHRNLCEDFKKIASICVNDIGICADITLENPTSLIKTQAEIIFQIQQYISPSIRFYSLSEMMEKGIPTEEIFNGPKLNHGFIIDSEIEESSLDTRRYIYASDIINIIQDVPGVLAVKNLLLTKYDKKGQPILPSEVWCLKIDPLHKAELSINKSKLLFFKEDLPYILSKNKFDKMLEEVDKLRTLHERYKLINPYNDFPVPQGISFPLDEYTPLRFSLPQTYGVGATGLPLSVSDARKGKAKQLSVFLAFFDQLLGNYLSQLANLGKIFSIDKQEIENQKRTYYNQFLSEEDLGVSYLDANSLEDNNQTIGADSLQRLTESTNDYLDRRNRFLDHLLGRFAEDFSDYALMVFSTQDDDTQQELIYDKVSFLKDYPTISSQRGKAFNYKNETALWNPENVVGLKKRASRLLGMPDYSQQALHCPTIRDEFETIEIGDKHTFRLKWGSIISHTSPKEFTSYEEAFYAKEKTIVLSTSLDNYTFTNVGPQYFYQVGELDPNDTSLHNIFLESTRFPSLSEAEKAARDFYRECSRDFSRAPLYEFLLEKNSSIFSYQLIHRNLTVLSSPKTFTDEALALESKKKAVELVLNLSNYTTKPEGTKHIFQIGILDESNPANSDIFCESVQQYESQEEAQNASGLMVQLFRSICFVCQSFDVLVENTVTGFNFYLKHGINTTLKSHMSYATKDEALLAKEKVIDLAFEESNFTTAGSGTNYIFQVGVVVRDQATGNVLTNDLLAKGTAEYSTAADARQAALNLQRNLNADVHCQIEGMHIIEHLLLRPKQELEDHFFEVCLGDDCFFCGEEDPYSFRASVILPYWTRKFSVDDPKLRKRQYIDRILRQEAPAHVHLKICWIDNSQMRLLDLHYNRWLEENAKKYPDKSILTRRLNALLEILGKLRNRYPEGFLHDCDDSEEENTILLNKSYLGSYNSPEN